MLPENLEKSFLRHISLEKGLSKNTCSAYLTDVRGFILYCAGKGLPPAKADSTFLNEYFLKARMSGRLKPSTMFRKMEAVRSFYRFLMLENIAQDDPTRNFKSPRIPERMPAVISRGEMERILSWPGGGGFPHTRTRSMAELLYATGIRISEMLGLNLESVNIEKGWIKVFGKGGKERMVPVHKTAVRTLKNYLAARQKKFAGKPASEYFFVNKTGKKLSRVKAWKDLRELGRKINTDKKIYPHLFRHTFASHLLQEGADLRTLQELLGHASLNTTQIYTHLDKKDLKAAHRRFHPEESK